MTHREALAGLFDAWRAGDAIRSGAYFAPDGTYREVRHQPIEGRPAIVEHFTRFFRDGPAFRFDVFDVLVDGDAAAVRYRFVTMPADALTTERGGCAFAFFRGGAIAEWIEYEG